MESMQSNWSYRLDLHVHTSRYSSCAEFLDPLQIGEYCRRADINGVVLTEHDTLWTKEELDQLRSRSPEIQIYNGIEVTTESGCHILVIGLEETGPLCKGIPFRSAVDYAHEQGAIVILAHPFRKTLPPLNIIALVDAVEVGSTSLYEKEAILSSYLATVLEKPVVASSDAHALSMIGWAYTLLAQKPENTSQLCQIIKEGRTEPVLPHPFLG